MEDGACFNTFCWIFQILVWITLALTIVFFVRDITSKIIFLILFIAFYITYIILELCSAISKYLCNKISENALYQKIGSYYRAFPIFKFYCECYHYSKISRNVRSGRSPSRKVTKRVRVVSHRETFLFQYYSARDVSGLLYLNCDKDLLPKKSFIELDIFDEINFADAISYYDYQIAKENFWMRNRFRDRYFHFNESRYIPGLDKKNLVSITNNGTCCINFLAYLIYTLLAFAEIYKIYYYSLCIRQIYRIRKLVSTRYLLNQPIYQDFNPKIDLINRRCDFKITDYNYINNDFQLVTPTSEELEKSKIYQNKVPDYKISSGGGGIHAGVVLDDPSYSSYDLNKPPEAFTSIAGNVELNNDQINEDGIPPPGFGQPGFKFNIDNKNNVDSNNNNNNIQEKNQPVQEIEITDGNN